MAAEPGSRCQHQLSRYSQCLNYRSLTGDRRYCHWHQPKETTMPDRPTTMQKLPAGTPNWVANTIHSIELTARNIGRGRQQLQPADADLILTAISALQEAVRTARSPLPPLDPGGLVYACSFAGCARTSTDTTIHVSLRGDGYSWCSSHLPPSQLGYPELRVGPVAIPLPHEHAGHLP